SSLVLFAWDSHPPKSGPSFRCLLLKSHRRPADSLRLEVDRDLDAIRNLDKWNSLRHPVVSTVEGHCPLDLSGACSRAGNRQRQRLRLRHSTDRKLALHIERGGAGLYDLL